MKQRLYALAWLMLGAVAAPALAATPTEARVTAFKTMLRTFEPMGLVVREQEPYRKDAFAKQAATLKTLAAEPFKYFPAGSADAKSRAKPEIWSQAPRFAEARTRFLTAVDGLNAAAQTGDRAAIRKAYGEVAQGCKSCHDAFRGPEK
ncbi:Cytochrome c556 [Gulbenkiania indica]|uniref:Cytochrome c556 n=1 Tax=Gulbenkiania indica TaxID=375574 RepID=A0A0K6GZV6_9NEIS|nr:cytochrome c [Gulbenkiania indica]CUA84268.1 Cytochrome c556 [Gulbenkiania indica]